MSLVERIKRAAAARPDAARWTDEDIERRARALVVRENEFGFDQFGMSRPHLAQIFGIARFMYRSYFRVECFGIEHVPASGRVLLISNHSGQLPFDGAIIGTALFLEPPQPRMVRAMVEHFVPTVPFMSYLFGRWGQITGTPENCRRLLHNDECVLVFPEGSRGISKPFTKRYQLANFGTGFMRLALETSTPIVPVAVIGAEEQAPAVNLKPVARLLGAPSFPVVPYPPFVPIVPLPSKYRLHFGPEMKFAGDPEDDELLEQHVHVVRDRIQDMVRVGLEERKHVFW